jgi:hypothetical protein
MQTLRSAVVPLLLVSFCAAFPCSAVAKIHTVTLGAVRKVPYTPAEANPDNKNDESATLKVRSLAVDGAQKEWTVGDLHEVTDRSFVIRRAIRINDALPDEAARWTWQPGPWLLVDRVTGHITALHLPAFDPEVSEAVWFRDFAAYCGVTTTAKGGLVMVVTELGARKAAVEKVVGPAPTPSSLHGACSQAKWQRMPMRVTLQVAGGGPMTFDVSGSVGLVEENETETQP